MAFLNFLTANISQLKHSLNVFQESLLVDDPEKDVCNGSHSATLSSGNTPNAIVESSKEESSDDTTKKSDNDNPSNVQCQSSANMNQLDEATCNAQQPPLSLETGKGKSKDEHTYRYGHPKPLLTT